MTTSCCFSKIMSSTLIYLFPDIFLRDRHVFIWYVIWCQVMTLWYDYNYSVGTLGHLSLQCNVLCDELVEIAGKMEISCDSGGSLVAAAVLGWDYWVCGGHTSSAKHFYPFTIKLLSLFLDVFFKILLFHFAFLILFPIAIFSTYFHLVGLL